MMIEEDQDPEKDSLLQDDSKSAMEEMKEDARNAAQAIVVAIVEGVIKIVAVVVDAVAVSVEAILLSHAVNPHNDIGSLDVVTVLLDPVVAVAVAVTIAGVKRKEPAEIVGEIETEKVIGKGIGTERDMILEIAKVVKIAGREDTLGLPLPLLTVTTRDDITVEIGIETEIEIERSQENRSLDPHLLLLTAVAEMMRGMTVDVLNPILALHAIQLIRKNKKKVLNLSKNSKSQRFKSSTIYKKPLLITRYQSRND
jgi:hypothetical protein